MKQHYTVFRRGNGIYYSLGTVTKKRNSLNTTDREEARRLLNALNGACKQPAINLQIAQDYLQHSDPDYAKRDWQHVMDDTGRSKLGNTKKRRDVAMKDKAALLHNLDVARQLSGGWPVSGGFQFGDQAGKQCFPGTLGVQRRRAAWRGRERFGASLSNLRHQSVHIAVKRWVKSESTLGGVGDFGHVAGPWADVKHGRTDSQDVVDLARMHQADKRIADHHDVHVGSRQRGAQLIHRLIGKAPEVQERLRDEG